MDGLSGRLGAPQDAEQGQRRSRKSGVRRDRPRSRREPDPAGRRPDSSQANGGGQV